jgi:cell division protease FtsH
VHTRHTPLDAGVHLDHLARLTAGMNGADLANLVNEAALGAARVDLDALTSECFTQALARIQLGALRPLVLSEQERRIIAIHECGHALVASQLPAADPVDSLTILARGRQVGLTRFIVEERSHLSRAHLMARIAVSLGGRIAVELVCGPDEVTTGAEEDLCTASALARHMVTRWGMGKEVGLIYAERGASVSPRRADLPGADSHSMQAVIDREVRCILKDGQQTARRILSAHRAQLLLLVTALMQQEQLDREQFAALLARSTTSSPEQC